MPSHRSKWTVRSIGYLATMAMTLILAVVEAIDIKKDRKKKHIIAKIERIYDAINKNDDKGNFNR